MPQKCVKAAAPPDESDDSGTSDDGSTSADAGTGTISVCQGPATCNFNSDCDERFVCAADRQCRNQCKADRDCNDKQLCAHGVCAEPSEVTMNGDLVGAVDGSTAPGSSTSDDAGDASTDSEGSAGSGGGNPGTDASAGAGGSTTGGGAGDTSGAGGMAGTGGTGGTAGTGGTPIDAGADVKDSGSAPDTGAIVCSTGQTRCQGNAVQTCASNAWGAAVACTAEARHARSAMHPLRLRDEKLRRRSANGCEVDLNQTTSCGTTCGNKVVCDTTTGPATCLAGTCGKDVQPLG